MDPALVHGIAPCGLVCGFCVHAAPGREACLGCRKGGGDGHCFQRTCCKGKGLHGCWECDEFPCEHGYFADEAWRGICIGLTQAIRDFGPAGFLERLVAKVGPCMELGDYRYLNPSTVRDWFVDEP